MHQEHRLVVSVAVGMSTVIVSLAIVYALMETYWPLPREPVDR